MNVALPVNCSNLIGGKFSGQDSLERIRSYNPATGELVGTAPESSVDVAHEAVEVAAKAFDATDWATNPILRSKALYSTAVKLEEHRAELVELLVMDAGKTIRDAELELNICIDTLEYYSGLARNLYGKSIDLSPSSFAILVREPIGVVAIITPWNWPLLLLIRSLAPALAAGNSVVIKPSSITPVTNYRFIELLHSTGFFPAGIVNCLTGAGRTVGRELAGDEIVGMISFTGETETGKEIMRLASNNIKKVSLELGGKSPNIVFADAPIEKAITAAIRGAFLTSGQVCFSGSRVLVEKEIHELFVTKAAKIASKMKVGYGIDPRIELGPLISQTQMEKVIEYIDEGKQRATLVTGGKRLENDGLSRGFFISPTIFDGVPSNSRIAREEIFGPVLSVQTFESEEDAIEKANDTKYGLAAAVWTKNIDRALKVSRKVKAGTVWINTYGKNYAPAEFGGYKQSGLGRLRGIEGMNEFTEIKHINIDSKDRFE
jgi:betaine-aldehyde dehydrogenase